MARVTLATIAERTGLSKFAVSRALSGKDGVSDATRRLVHEVAAELGYVRVAPEVEPPMLGVIFHDADRINSELHMLIQSGVQVEAQRLGYRVGMRWTHIAEEIESFVRNCACVLMVGPHDGAGLARAYATGKPIVRTGWLDPLEPADWVGGTDHESGSAVANYLLELGHRSIAFVHGTPGYRGRMERYYGVREVLEMRPDVEYREMKFEAEMRFTEHFLVAQEQGFSPTAFFCAHDGLAVTVVSELLRLGYRIPEDISVVGFGDFSAATQISPQLTTVKVHGQEMGAACVRLLDDRIHGRMPRDTPIRVMIAGHIVQRASSGPLQPASRPAPAVAASARRGR